MQAERFTFSITEEVQKAIDELGYEQPTPIQQGAIPPMLEGRDVIGQAQTGTGKTAAFGIPLVQAVDASDRRVQALVLCPTRELAVQTAGEIMKLGRFIRGLRALAVYGGQPIERQLRELSWGVQVVVGTPGRVMDHMRRGSLDLSDIKICILDEADEMLDMGFRDDIETILSGTNEDKQMALFSATMPLPILSLARKYLNDPVSVRIAPKEMTVDTIEQLYINVRPLQKTELLSRLMVLYDIKRALIFCNTKLGVEDVVTRMQARGFQVAGLHGDMRQMERDAIMARFKQGTVDALVATDVAARGLDIDDVDAVFNYDMPQDVEYYVHRIGRTGRAGKEGMAITFVCGREVSRMWEYRKITGAKILCRPAPTGEEIRKARLERLYGGLAERMENGQTEGALHMARRILSEAEPEHALAAALTALMEEVHTGIDESVDLRPPEPVRAPAAQQKPFPPRSARPRYERGGGSSRPPQGKYPPRKTAYPPRSEKSHRPPRSRDN
ncbi:MAG: DEAD/DEAH box helicase [Christensenellales bacterium]|jgi:ATP-dependent RNA helicase DeaD